MTVSYVPATGNKCGLHINLQNNVTHRLAILSQLVLPIEKNPSPFIPPSGKVCVKLCVLADVYVQGTYLTDMFLSLHAEVVH